MLPKIVKMLVDKRNDIKKEMDQEQEESKKHLLNLKQQTVKIIANSIYGCLGSKTSRFFCKPMAALITFYGRKLLKQIIAQVEDRYNVIYGDTDSVMISTGT